MNCNFLCHKKCINLNKITDDLFGNLANKFRNNLFYKDTIVIIIINIMYVIF